LASSQFSPRVLRTFTGDRSNQVVLGVFIGTFTYSLLILRTVHSASQDLEVFVPSASVTVAILLALASIGFLIFYIHHASRSIQASVIIDRATQDTLALLADMDKRNGNHGVDDSEVVWRRAGCAIVTIAAERTGYVQSIDRNALAAMAEEEAFWLRTCVAPGDFVLSGHQLAEVMKDERGSGTTSTDEGDLKDRIRGHFVLGIERTLAQDWTFGLRQLVDIALKALSPGINDPTTAMLCIDRLSEVLAESMDMGSMSIDTNGRVHVKTPSPDDLVASTFDQICHYGAGDASVVLHILHCLESLAQISPALRPALARQANVALQEASAIITVPQYIEHIRQAVAQIHSGPRNGQAVVER
jgi:uncharacterized membrane protein